MNSFFPAGKKPFSQVLKSLLKLFGADSESRGRIGQGFFQVKYVPLALLSRRLVTEISVAREVIDLREKLCVLLSHKFLYLLYGPNIELAFLSFAVGIFG